MKKQKIGIENRFDVPFTAVLAQKEKQIQQNYRPIIGIHKWFARRPGSVFRNLLLSEFNGEEPIDSSYWRVHNMAGIVADPFMGGGTPIFEANRLGFSVVGTDINPMAYWIVRQSLVSINQKDFVQEAKSVTIEVEKEIGSYYTTTCRFCGKDASIKYFIWVKTQKCPDCGTETDLFPGYLLAEAVRHPKNVIACNHCGHLNEFDDKPSIQRPKKCEQCTHPIYVEGNARNNRAKCGSCGFEFKYPVTSSAPIHRMWAIEYHCENCKPNHTGRFFKESDQEDIRKFEKAQSLFNRIGSNLPIPNDKIPLGDETRRLHQWGYRHFREMFNDRQLLGLGLLLKRIKETKKREIRHALLTVFSDFLRYQNMLCRYDTYALKCQDIFSVHGFPVGLVQCENSLLGIPKVGSGAFRHFIEKYLKAKQYCRNPFETRFIVNRKDIVYIEGEKIEAKLVNRFPNQKQRQAFIKAADATSINLPAESLDGVFTDPPYYNNVQYAELMDFCYAWLRLGLKEEFKEFRPNTTRTDAELTGNVSMQRGLDSFTGGLSKIFCHYATALKIGAPFVFTYHHNDPDAYIPLIIAILDAGLNCTATLPVPAEMGASLHIARSKSSVLDTVFVCRKRFLRTDETPLAECLKHDMDLLSSSGLKLSEGDIKCLLSGHIARKTINQLRYKWKFDDSLAEKMSIATEYIARLRKEVQTDELFLKLKEKSTKSRGGHAASI